MSLYANGFSVLLGNDIECAVAVIADSCAICEVCGNKCLRLFLKYHTFTQ